jgi:MtN3 and saliva related transmembrane protein
MINQIIGYSGTTCLIITLMPQLIKTYNDKHAEDISIGFILLNLLTSILLLIYGILIEQGPIMLANCILILQNLIFLYFKKKYSIKNNNNNDNNKMNKTNETNSSSTIGSSISNNEYYIETNNIETNNIEIETNL